VKAEDIHPGHYLVYPKISLPEEEVAPLKIFGDVQRQFPNIPYTRIAEDLDIHPSTVAAIATGRYRKTGQVVNVVEKYLDTIGFKLWSQSVEPVAFDCDFAKFLGLYIAEGNVSGNTVRLTFHSDEHDLISFTEGWFESIGITSSRIEYDDRNGVTVMGSSAEMGRWLVDVCGTGSASMHIPKFIMSAPRTHKEAFLAGYLLGDGHFSTSRVSFTTTSLSLFGDIRTLCNSMGMLVKFHEKASYKENWLKQYGASLAGSVWRGIADRNGLPCSAVKRPHEPYLQDDKYYYVKVSSVSTSTADETPVFNFEVEDDHSYLADGVVSHNCNFEIVPRRNGIPAEFIAVDAATVKVVSDRLEQRDYNFGNTTSGDSTPYDYGYLSQANGSSKNQRTRKTTYPRLVQVVNGQIKATFDEWEMAMGIRNPRTDILANGYGFSEIEMIVMTITAHMNAETYNRKFFSQGSSIKGVITFEGMVPQDQLEAFRRQWHQQVSGVSNAWKTPIMALGKDNKMNWQSLHSTNREMEWGKYMEYLIKCICGTYQIDPLEIGFDIASHASGSGGGGGLGSLQKGYQLDRIIESKDKGLRPLLVFLSNILNEYIVWRIDPNFTLEFVGLNSRSEKDEVDLEKSKVETFKMIDEIRAENDLQPLPKPEDIKGPGQILLNPQYIQALTAWNQLKGIQDPNSMGAPGMGAPGQGGPGQDADSTATSSDGVPANQPGEPDYENMSTDELQSELDKLNGNTGDQKGKSNPQDKKLAPASVEKSLEFLL
jgi:intein/homing endonuclease